jgi:hypothetical protein
MALKPCKECGRSISTEANSCPHCGKKNPTGPNLSRGQIGCLAFLVLIVLGQLVDLLGGGRTAPTSPVSSNAPAVSESVSAAPAPQVHEDIRVSDTAPYWYNGAKPWSAIGVEGRETMMRMRAKFEADQAAANQPGSRSSDKAAAKGRRLIDKIVRSYGLDDVYREPDTFGPRMVIWLPQAAWAKLSQGEKKSIEAYMESKYANWGIGVGRVRGKDVMYDDLVVEH